MHSTIGIDIDAPPALVFALARDTERWARLLPHYPRSRAVGVRRADGTLLVDFVAREGWRFGTRVEIDHEVRPAVPLFAVVVDRFFTRPSAGRTLATFRDLAEALASVPRGDDHTDPDESGPPVRANPPP